MKKNLYVLFRLISILACTATGAIAQSNWQQLSPATAPDARLDFGHAYDQTNNVTVIFGGDNGMGGFLNDTWTFDGSDWTQVTTATTPAGRSSHAMAFDVNSGEAVIFGGVKGVAPIAETWTFSGTDWTQESPAASPSNRAFPAMAYHAASNKIILFGGLDGAAMPTSDTWSWNGTNWTNESPATTPPARYWTALAYDATRQKTVMFGGFENIGPSALSDVWEWDGTDWTKITPASGPSARFTHRMSYDSTLEKIVLFGGSTLTDPLNETWTWDGTTWEQLTPGTAPSARSDHGQVFDSQNGSTIIFGGATGTGVLSETWRFGAVATPTPTATATPTPTATPEVNPTLSNIKVKGPRKIKKGKKATYKVSGQLSAPGTVIVQVRGKGLKGRKTISSSAGSWIAKVKLKAKKKGKIKASFKILAKNNEGISHKVTLKKKIKVK